MSDQQDGDDTDAGLRTEDGAPGRDPGALVCGSADTLVGDSGGDYPATGWSQLSRDDQVEHFQIIKLLGRGGMGEVYLARDTKLGRKVALKRILPNTLDNAESIERFLFEARTTAQFSHPNIVTVYAVGEHHGVPYLALEYLPGQTLRNRMKDGELSHREVARLGLAIAAALTEAHRHGVLHRDLKPANVVVPPDGRLRVLDFGLAGIVESVDAVTAAPGELGVDTHKDGLVGTPPYMAPEQWLCDTLTETVDVWALGLILYELVDGRHPYLGVDFTGLGAAVCAPDPVPPMSSREAVPEPLAEVIDGCLHKDSAKRLSASEIGRRLEAFLHFGGRRLDEDESPFRGLLPFTERHGSTFFGRDAEIDRFVEQLRHQSLVPVVGPSGAGKSSFVRAGVVPRLRDGARWVMVRMRPGNHPFETLAQELHRASADPASRDSTTDIRGPLVPDTSDLAARLEDEPARLALELRACAALHDANVLLFVDQLEELVTLVADPALCTRFMTALSVAADEPLDPVRVVVTLRDDFVSRLATTDLLQAMLSRIFLLRRPDSQALEEVLRKPVSAAGYEYDDGALPTTMVAAVQDEPACLPLLQFAAQLLWEKRDRTGRLLQSEVYHAMGGVEGALAQHADGVLAALTASETGVAHQLLMRLVTGDRTRKVVVRRDLLEGLGDGADNVLERLTKARLLTVRRQQAAEAPLATVELTHESLIIRWGTLRQWLDEGHEDLVFIAEAEQAATLWERRGQRDEELWQGDALTDALRMMDRCSQPVPERVLRFVGAAERRRARRRRLRRWVQVGVVSALALVVAVLGFQNREVEAQRTVAQQERNVARQERNVARQERAAGQVQYEAAQAQRAVALVEGARAAVERGQPLEARAKLRQALEITDAPSTRVLWWQLRGEAMVARHPVGSAIYTIDFSPDGETIAAACQDKTAYLIDAKTGAERALQGHSEQVLAVEFSPDGRTLATGDYAGQILFWDVRTGRQKGALSAAGGVSDVRYRPDGRALASAGPDQIQVWDLATGRVEHSLTGHTGNIRSLSWTADGRRLASGSYDGTIRLWDMSTGRQSKVLAGHTGMVYRVQFSPDDRLLASSSADETARVWEVETGVQRQVLKGHTATVAGLRFSPDGRLLATTGDDQTVRLWQIATGRLLETFSHHEGAVRAVSFSPDGRHLATGSADQTVRLWDVHTQRREPSRSGHTEVVYGVGFSPDGRWVASGSSDGTVRLWDVQTGQQDRVLSGHTAGVEEVVFSPDGRLLASASGDKTVRLWELRTGRIHRVLSGHESGIGCVGFTPDSRRVVSAGFDRTIRVWDVHTGREERVLTGHTGGILSMGVSPDGRLIASGGIDETIRLWDLRTGAQLGALSGHTGWIFGVHFSPDSRMVASGGRDKTARLWDVQRLREAQLIPQPARVHNVAFHPDGRHLALPGADGVVRMWDIQKKVTTSTLRGHRSEINFVRFSLDGRWAATGSDDKTLRLWDVSTGRPAWRAPLLMGSPARLLSHRGWTPLDAAADRDPSPKMTETHAWQRAVEERARYAAVTPDGRYICVQTYEGELEIWALEGDTRIRREAVPGLTALRAVNGGCLVRTQDDTGGRALLMSAEGETRTLATEGAVTALGVGPNELLVAAGANVFVFDAEGAPTARRPASVLATAVTRIDADRLAVGYGNGSIELVSAQDTPTEARYAFERASSSPVTRIMAGPMDTLIVGFGSGTVGLWSWRDGKRLAHERIHGPVEHLLIEGDTLYAAGALGQSLVFELDALYAEHCDLLREVWARVPVVWKDGRAVVEPPPAAHGCRSR